MEAAASLRARGLDVTVVAPSRKPFEATLGPEVGALFRRAHEERGVKFKLGSIVYRFEGTSDVEAVTLEGGERIEADMVVAGVGVHPATGFLEGVGLDEDGGVFVDEHMRAADGLYAAGDIACFPDPRTGARSRIEHWRTAQQQGRVAAHNMAGRRHGLRRRALLLDAAVRHGAALRRPRPRVGRDHLRRRRGGEGLPRLLREGRAGARGGGREPRPRRGRASKSCSGLNLMPEADELRAGATDFAELLRALTAAPECRDAGACAA